MPPATAPSATVPPTAASTIPATSSAPTAPPTTQVHPAAALVVTRGDPARRLVALTFDAGSDAGNTTRILDLLAADHIHATFGITGQWAQANPGLLRRIAADGHQIVNHTFDHRSFTGASTATAPLTRPQRLAELAQAETTIAGITGTGTSGWFRPPYGDRDAGVDADAAAGGYRYELMWTVDSLGWKGTPADTVATRCIGAVIPGAIFLFHVGAASTDADALPAIIAGLEAAGYGFATAADILA